ncbi:MAG: DUF5058 family protein [Bacillota bacterium]|nr:DUF5058 family protein [Bacillota bacterium]
MNYLDIANSSFVFIMCGLLIFTVLVISCLFLRHAWKTGLELEISREIMIRTIKSSMTFSIAPSIPIVIALTTMVGVLGIPFPWMRLSIIGSFQYELMTAKIGASAMGIESLGGAGYTAQVFSNSMWVMSLGIIWGMLFCLFFLKKFSSTLENAQKKDSSKIQIIITALYFGMLSVFVGPPMVSGGVQLYTLLVSALLLALITWITRKNESTTAGDWAFTLSMVGGMIFAAFYTNIF